MVLEGVYRLWMVDKAETFLRMNNIREVVTSSNGIVRSVLSGAAGYLRLALELCPGV